MNNIVNLQALRTNQRLDALEKDNDHLRMRLDQSQEDVYLLECEVIELRYNQANTKFPKPKLGDSYGSLEQYLSSFGGDVDRMIKAKQNWGKLVDKILKGR